MGAANTVVFRVDAGARMGIGHLMRCLTLADAARAGGARTRFVARALPECLSERLARSGHEFLPLAGRAIEPTDELAYAGWLGSSQRADAEATARIVAETSCDWLVVDHYGLDARWERSMRAVAKRILVIDDLADRTHDCDLLLDQNHYSDLNQRYGGKVPVEAHLLLGPRFALLRDEFARRHTEATARSGPVRRLLVSFGGVDQDNLTSAALAAIEEYGAPDWHVEVVIGAQHPVAVEVQRACARLGYVCHIQAANMAEIMAASDLAIGAGGALTWERCCVGLPTITLAIADNQRKLVDDAAESGLVYAPVIRGDLATGLGWHLRALAETPAIRTNLSREGLATVDGRGVARVLHAMALQPLTLRVATERDALNLLAWRNHPDIRRVSRQREPISAEQHGDWLRRVLANPDWLSLIGLQAGQPVGVLRFDVAGDGAEVSIYLVPGIMGQGVGRRLLASGEDWLRQNRPEVRRVQADVLGDNEPSHRFFCAAGYANQQTRYLKSLG